MLTTTGFKHKKNVQKFKRGGVVGSNAKDISVLQKGIDSGILSEEIVSKMKAKIAELKGIGVETDDKTDFDFTENKIQNKINSEDSSKRIADEFTKLNNALKSTKSTPQLSEREYFASFLNDINISIKYADNEEEKAYFEALKSDIEISLKYSE